MVLCGVFFFFFSSKMWLGNTQTGNSGFHKLSSVSLWESFDHYLIGDFPYWLKQRICSIFMQQNVCMLLCKNTFQAEMSFFPKHCSFTWKGKLHVPICICVTTHAATHWKQCVSSLNVFYFTMSPNLTCYFSWSLTANTFSLIVM